MRSRDCDEDEIQANQEGDHNHQLNLNSMFQPQNQPSSVPTSRQWTSAFRNPRIVRVSRTFGGKDRHSKVCTVRGLRDRRIRLSVPTAIQVYDLQDRLGLSQPSKVIDWLLEAAKDDVDELPPLQFPQGFNQMYPSLIFGESSSTSAASTFPGTNFFFFFFNTSSFWYEKYNFLDPKSQNVILFSSQWLQSCDLYVLGDLRVELTRLSFRVPI